MSSRLIYTYVVLAKYEIRRVANCSDSDGPRALLSQAERVYDQKIELLTMECWSKRRVDKSVYESYLTEFNYDM